MDPETARVSALIENNSDATGGLLRLSTDVQSFVLADGTARSGEALADISFSDTFATAGALRMGLLRYRFEAISRGGDLTGRAAGRVRFGSDVDFETGSGGPDPLTRIVESGGLVPFELGRNIAIELTLEARAFTFFDNDEVNSLAESSSIQISRELRFFEADGVTEVSIVGAHPEVPEPQTFLLAAMGLAVLASRRLLRN
ncbi:MAG: PEP-CTERM sorting domain-containing protein [Burkholderiales bacterium]